MKPELVADYPCETGEAPIWHTEEARLYWTDIPNGILYRYDPSSDSHQVVLERDTIGGTTIQSDGSLLLFGAGGIVERWDGETVETVTTLDEAAETRFNDVIADPEGRVFCGTMSTADRLGSLYRLNHDGTFTRIVDEADIPNGMGFSPDHETFYFTVSNENAIYACDYETDTGTISDRSVLVSTADEVGVPDGLTVNESGDLWSARWDGRTLVRYAPTGEERERVEFPVEKVSSVTFGGSSFEQLYVTTAGGYGRPEEGALAGSLFRVTPDSTGTPEFRSRIFP
ncbi:SMP-30/gluconolactonase/LRE family protein [Haladaptatus sp. DFWS20]|uniref:SMP-30/gluconolactonase/LRE family protein n=1 Tax=Haladaptatus sp. DFWS20 TaxID=3403467 RepID=UPI003EBDBDD8